MSLTYSIWQEEFTVRTFEVDSDGLARLPVVANNMQEAAGSHAAKLGLSMQSLLDMNQTWILNRFSVEMIRYPKMGEKIRIETWPMGADRLFAYRDFELFDASGNKILCARTAWLILDYIRRRPLPTPENVKALGEQNKRFADIEVASKFPKVSGEPLSVIEIPVRRADLDINRHVNNVKYLEMVLETLGEGDAVARPGGFDIQFKAESVMGDVLLSERYATEQEGLSMHIIRRKSDQKELCQAIMKLE